MTKAKPVGEQTSLLLPAHALLVSGACVALLGLHLGLRHVGGKLTDGLDPVALGLALVGLSPWIARILDSTKFAGFEINFRKMKEQVEDQRGDIDTLKFLIGHFLGRTELRLLTKLASDDPYEIDVTHFPAEFQAELRHLRGLGFVDNKEGLGIRTMYEHDPHTVKRDVRRYFFVTESGRQFLALRGAVA